ncbi:SDR family NAD(P)-dependent oxidoreductase [Kribbella solani]|uniref:SDR family oxidoreductase n=1 Tax=Kribbella solani TaxID=236067 RepID=UPI0029BA4A8E|nr:SDR family NAD(P)-dependent oxidoreductase [Kribbella solani]MDX2970137.1 SDR family NAD(P)-dependent oxidoreductase [Kribbella solani]MDX3004236.1 SDR family NAD(P)-dependent oxidoreductase [Kribbella solani]
MTPLRDRIAMVTGGGRGIGEAASLALAAAGAGVAVLDLDPAAAGEVVQRIETAGGTAIAVACDVADYASVAGATARVADTFGAVDLVVANAGIGDYSALSDGDVQRWRRLLEVNVLGVAHVVRATLAPMKAAGFGDVVIMSSIAGRETWAGEPIYIASKHALTGLGGSLRRECAAFGVRVTLVEPTIVDTPLVRGTELGREELDRYAALTADDVARAVVYAVSQPPAVGVAEILLRAVGPEA